MIYASNHLLVICIHHVYMKSPLAGRIFAKHSFPGVRKDLLLAHFLQL
jgi:hypothetical protein